MSPGIGSEAPDASTTVGTPSASPLADVAIPRVGLPPQPALAAGASARKHRNARVIPTSGRPQRLRLVGFISAPSENGDAVRFGKERITDRAI